MVFSSISFVFGFIPIFFIIYYLVPNRFKNPVILIGSLIFYAFGEIKYLPLILLTLLLNYLFAIKIQNTKKVNLRKLYLWIILIYDIGMLFVYKYLGFLIKELNIMNSGLSESWSVPIPQIPALSLVLPLGISFYTFQIVSYVVDVYRKKVKAERNFVSLGTYLCMFPQLIAGPIVIYSDISEQLKKRFHSLELFEDGLKTFVLGLGSKIIIANVLGNLWNEIQVTGFESISVPLAWLGVFAYTFQIYFDFNGYSLMAIGLGKMLGFNIPRNFYAPYLARSVSEFWRRWHITLGQWFREYVYIPLGGSRNGKVRTIFNLFVVWSLTGLWHGADWNFLLWGLLFFVFIALEKLGLGKILDRHYLLSRLYMLAIIPLSWMVFAIDGLDNLKIYFSRLFPFFTSQQSMYTNSNDVFNALSRYGIFFLLAIVICTQVPSKIYSKYKKSWFCILILLGILWFSVWQMMTSANNPFLYFRF